MKRLSAGLFLLIGLGCCGDTSPAGPKTVEFVRSEGTSSYLFAFRAHQSADGEISGYIVSRSTPDHHAPFVVEGRVSCVKVVGHRASIGGELQRLLAEDLSEASQDRGWVFYVEDNRDRGGPDRLSKYIYVSKDPVTNCPTPAADSATETVSGGDDVVVSSTE